MSDLSGHIYSRVCWFLLTATAITVVVSQIAFWGSNLRFGGDEPHVLMTVISIIKNHSLNIYPNYEARDYKTFGYEELSPQVAPKNQYIPPEKGIGFPAIIAPFYASLGLAGTRLALLFFCLLAFPLLLFNCIWLNLPRASAALACLALASAMPWEVHSGLILPEAFAGTMVMGIVAAYLRFEQTKHWRYAFLIGLLTVLLPMIYLKYSTIAVSSGVLLTANRSLRTHPATYSGAPLLALYTMLWVSVYGWSISVGTGAGPADFQLSGVSRWFWYAFVDRDYGIWIYAPITILAIFGFLRWRPQANLAVQTYLVAVVGLYALLYAFLQVSPGASAPGRYLTAVLPAMILLSAIAIIAEGEKYSLRFTIYCLFVAASAIMLFGSIINGAFLPVPSFIPRLYYPNGYE